MAKQNVVRLRDRTLPVATRARKTRYNEQSVSGGNSSVIGYTKDMSELVGYERMNKNLFGLFGDQDSPHRSVVELDIGTGNVTFPVIEPLFAYKSLIRLHLSSTILRQCIEAYVTNIESYGTELEYTGPEGQQDSRAATNEKLRIERILSSLVTNGEDLIEARRHSRVDKEVLGARAFEVIQDAVGRTIGFNRVETSTLRMTRREPDAIEVDEYNPLTGTKRKVSRRFRRFLQIRDDNKKIWFKEFGDPRPVDPTTGKEDPSLQIEAQATAIYYDPHYTPGTPYGTPQWAGCIPGMLGAREAEMVNLDFFRDNAIPAMAVLVSGGALTEESFEKIEQYFAGVRGRKSMNRIVVLEATPEGSDAAAIDGSLPAPKVDIKPMLSDRQHEALFGQYIEATDTKVRSSFRLPPIYIGSAKEYNRASAFASVLTAEQQVFTPERMAWDAMFDRVVLSSHNFKFWRVRSRGPGINDPQEIARIVSTLGKEGALTPNIAIKLANRFLDANIETVIAPWGDFPFALVMEYVRKGTILEGVEELFSTLEASVSLITGPVPQPGEEIGDEEDDEDVDEAETVEEEDDEEVAVKASALVLLDELVENLRRELDNRQ